MVCTNITTNDALQEGFFGLTDSKIACDRWYGTVWDSMGGMATSWRQYQQIKPRGIAGNGEWLKALL